MGSSEGPTSVPVIIEDCGVVEPESAEDAEEEEAAEEDAAVAETEAEAASA